MSAPILIEFNGKIATLKEHCKDLGVSPQSVRARKRKLNITAEECLSYYLKNGKQPNKPTFFEFNGKIATLKEHCVDLGIKVDTVKSRHRRTGESYEQCLGHYQEYGLYNYSQRKGFSLQIEFNGKIASVAEHCRDLGVKPSTLWSRKHRTGETDLECLEYFQKNGVKSIIRHNYKVKDKRLYSIWTTTKQKCENLKHPAYKNYGGRGIKVCDRWQNYENFENDLLDSYLNHVEQYGVKETTIDRWPNNDGDYEPNNVRWATYKEQMNNRRSNRMVTNELNATQLAEKYDINYSTVLNRLNKGWSVKEIINTPTGNHIKYYLPCNNGTMSLSEHCNQNDYNYETIIKYVGKYNLQPHEALAKWLKMKNSESISQIAKRLGVSRQAIQQRLQRGQSLEQIIDIFSKKVQISY